jgi:sterol desaturase/sphingolipid hydroxylase (fatty acid hydroxylase superfamily)
LKIQHKAAQGGAVSYYTTYLKICKPGETLKYVFPLLAIGFIFLGLYYKILTGKTGLLQNLSVEIAMLHYPINHDPEPIRLFKSDFLEFFTHISPVTVTIIWLPVAGFFLARAILSDWGSSRFPVHIPLGFLLGLFLWTLAEYLLHRFVFHYTPKNAWQERVVYLFHGIHHHQPQCKTRLVMPPVVSVPLAVLFYALFSLVAGRLFHSSAWVDPLVSGFIIGYLVYDLTHYATHHFPMRQGWFKFLKRYHMQHHYKTPDQRFCVSSPVWDWVFQTWPRSEETRG